MSDIAVGFSKFIKCNESLLFLMNYIFIQGASTLMNQRSIYSLSRHGVRALVTIQGASFGHDSGCNRWSSALSLKRAMVARHALVCNCARPFQNHVATCFVSILFLFLSLPFQIQNIDFIWKLAPHLLALFPRLRGVSTRPSPSTSTPVMNMIKLPLSSALQKLEIYNWFVQCYLKLSAQR